MNLLLPIQAALKSVPLRRRSPRPVTRSASAPLTIAAAIVAFAIFATPALAAPPPPTDAELFAAWVDEHAQTFSVADTVVTAAVSRDQYSATPGIATLVAGGTNHDWAKLVLLLGGFPMTESNVTVFTRWMRQENGVDDWWNRNNPLNNGWGSGGGGGTGTYDNLVIAAENAAAALRANPGYGGIVAAFESGGPTEQVEAAIWASPWASGHYAYGGHWSYATVPAIKAPDGTW